MLEETGYRADSLELLGSLVPDAGRLGNRMWCFFAATTVPVRPLQPSEPELEALAMTPRTLQRRLQEEGARFAKLRDQVRHQHACKALRQHR